MKCADWKNADSRQVNIVLVKRLKGFMFAWSIIFFEVTVLFFFITMYWISDGSDLWPYSAFVSLVFAIFLGISSTVWLIADNIKKKYDKEKYIGNMH